MKAILIVLIFAAHAIGAELTAAAKLELGEQLLDGGVRPDYNRALALIRAACDEYEPGAALSLANLYSYGIGEPRSAGETPIALIRRALNEGGVEEIMGTQIEARLRYGVGVERDLLLAAAFYFRIPKYAEPALEKKSRERALREDPNQETMQKLDALFEKALGKNDHAALVELAKLHAEGLYGQANLARAAALLTVANEPIPKLDAEQRKQLQADLKWMRQR